MPVTRPSPALEQPAAFAQCLTALVVAGRWTLSTTPLAWRGDTAGTSVDVASDTLAGPFASMITTAIQSTPMAALALRASLLEAAVLVALAVLVVRGAYGLFRGPGRSVAAVSAGVLAAESCLPALQSSASPIFATLDVALAAALVAGIGALAGSLVHHGKVTGRAFSRGLAATMGLAVLGGVPGLCMGVPLMAVASLRRFRSRRRSVSPVPWSGVAAILVVGGLSALAAWVGATGSLSASSPWTPVPSLSLELPPFAKGPAGFPTRLLWPAYALLVVLLLPLRWRGGLTMTALTLLSVSLHVDGELIGRGLPGATLLAMCAAGWIWLAGSVASTASQPRHGQVYACLAVGALVLWASPRVPWAPRAAPLRPARELLEITLQGLAAPRDVALITDATLRARLAEAQRVDGVRPDVTIHDPRTMTDTELLRRSLTWAAEGRRIVSDSYDLGGRWPPGWAVESGPLYWFVFDAERAASAPAMLATATVDSLAPDTAGAYARMLLERARFRQAVGRPGLAARALATIDDELGQLPLAVELASQTRMPSDVASLSRLPPGLSGLPARAAVSNAAWLCAGDLLFHVGDLDGGETTLLEATPSLPGPAWSVLLGWLQRSGQLARARAMLDSLLDSESDACANIEAVLDATPPGAAALAALTQLADTPRLQGCAPTLRLRLRLGALVRTP